MSRHNLSDTRGESRSIRLRVSENDDFTIRRAAAVRGETLSEFVRLAALRRAQSPAKIDVSKLLKMGVDDMKTYTIEYSDGRCTDFASASDSAAVKTALAKIGRDAIAADQWDPDGWNGEDEPMKRLLIWACEADSVDDDGANAIAALTCVGTV